MSPTWTKPGTVTLSARRPQVSVAFTASLTDLDATESKPVTSPTWQWAKSSSKNGSYTDIDNAEEGTTYDADRCRQARATSATTCGRR